MEFSFHRKGLMLNRILSLALFLSLLIVPFVTSALNEQSPFEFIKLFVLGIVSLCVFSAFVLNMLARKKFEFRWNHGLSLVGLILLVNTISFIFSNSLMNSFWADINVPTDSLLTMIVFFLFCFSLTQTLVTDQEVRVMNIVLITMATAMAGYGVIQHFGLDPIDWWGYKQMTVNAYGTIGQAVGFGMILGSIIALVAVNFLQAEGLIKKCTLLLSLLIISLGILYSGSRAPALAALFVVLTGLAVYLFKNRTVSALKKTAAVLLVLALAQSVYFFEDKPSTLEEKMTGESIGQGFGERTHIWGDALAVWKKYPILGAGPETFGTEQRIVNRKEHNQFQHWELLWTKAHNHYIHHLATTGILGLAAELLLLFFLVFDFFRLLREKSFEKQDLDGIGHILGYFFLSICYLTAFNFVVTQLFSYLLPTLYFIRRSRRHPNVVEVKLPRFFYLTCSVVAVLLSGQLIFAMYNYWRADVLFGVSKREFLINKNAANALKAIDEAILIQSYNPRLYCRKATIITALLTSNPNQYSRSQMADTIKLIDELASTCVNLEPRNAENIALRAKLFAELFLTRLIDSPAASLEGFREAEKVNPNNPTYYYRSGSLYLSLNQPDEYLKNMRLALDMKPDYLPAYTDLIGFYYRRGDRAEVDRLVQSVAKLHIDKGEFVPELGNMINLAELNKDPQSHQILVNVYMAAKHLIE